MDKKRILIVDDEKDFVTTMLALLQNQGYEVLSAFDGIDGLQKIKSNTVDLIVLDVMMPRLDGYKVCRMIKFDKKYKGIPIVMLTARVHEEDVKLGEEVGADAYVTKPIKPEILLDRIKNLLTA